MSDESPAAMEIASVPERPAPVPRQQRISSLDVLRGVAVLGILLMNIIGFGLPHWAYDDPTVVGGATGLNLFTWITMNMLFEGTMRAMFSLLFGAGVILLTSRLESRMEASAAGGLTPADIFFRRNMWLIVFGLVHSYLLLWLGDILFAYGLVGMFLFVFRRVRPSRLILLAALILAAIVARSVHDRHGTLAMIAAANDAETRKALGEELNEEQKEAIKDWTEEREDRKPDAAKVKREIDEARNGYLSIMITSAPINVWLESQAVYKYGFWDAACMMFLGMALMKLGVLSGSRSRGFYAGMLIIGYSIGLSVNAYETTLLVRNHFAIEAFEQANLTYDVGRVAMVFGHIGLIMLIIQSGAFRKAMATLAAVGQMALTNYLATSIVCGLIFHGYGLSRFGHFERWQLYLVVAGVWLLQLLVSPIWLRHFQFGPAEWLWRSLTYWKRQPMLRGVRTDAPLPTPPVYNSSNGQ